MTNMVTYTCDDCGKDFTVDWQNGVPANPKKRCNNCWIDFAAGLLSPVDNWLLAKTKLQTIKNVRERFDLSLADAHSIVTMWSEHFDYNWSGNPQGYEARHFYAFCEKADENIDFVHAWKRTKGAYYEAKELLEAGFKAKMEKLINNIQNAEPF